MYDDPYDPEPQYPRQPERLITPNPCYPGEADPGYEGLQVRYDIESIPEWRAVRSAWDVHVFAKERGMLDDARERVYAVYFGTNNAPQAYRLVSSGTLNASLVDARGIFGPAVALQSAAVIVIHNHPSGSLEPSPTDRALSEKLRQAGALLDVPLLDFMIVSREGYMSFLDDGLL